MKVIADSTPLIHFSKIGCMNLIKKIFENIIIPRKVYEEAIIEGKRKGKSEVAALEELIAEGFIIVKDVALTNSIGNLDKGESECIALCRELSIKTILIDEEDGFRFCQMLNLIPLRSTSLLIIFLDKKIISLERYKELLRELSESKYFLDAKKYELLIRIGESITKK